MLPLALVGATAVLVSVAPAERTLGVGIRWVYVHVGLVWAGTAVMLRPPLPAARPR